MSQKIRPNRRLNSNGHMKTSSASTSNLRNLNKNNEALFNFYYICKKKMYKA